MYAEKISTINRLLLSVIFVGVVFLSSQTAILESIRSSIISQIILIGEEMEIKDYSSYAIETNRSFFTIGNILGIVFFFLVVISRDEVVDKYDNGRFIYGMAIVQMFLARLLIMIPTGFRLNIPFGMFYMLYVVYLIRSKHVFRWIFILYFCVTFPRLLWNAYVYIPYSNSIPYIIKGHKSYNERSIYNFDAYQKRTGKSFGTDKE